MKNDNFVYASIDVETTGLNPLVHSMWEIAVLVYDPEDYGIKHRFVTKMKPDLLITHPTAIRFAEDRGIDLESINLLPSQARSCFLEWKQEMFWDKKIYPLGWNYPFDKSFIERWLGFDLYAENFHYKFVDVFQRWLFAREGGLVQPRKGNSLADAIEYYKLENNSLHSAYGDAKQTLKVASYLGKSFKRVISDAIKLSYLESAGVDNWEGYSVAMEMKDEEV